MSDSVTDVMRSNGGYATTLDPADPLGRALWLRSSVPVISPYLAVKCQRFERVTNSEKE